MGYLSATCASGTRQKGHVMPSKRHNETTNFHIAPKPTPPATSWWLGKSGAAFSAEAKAQQPRMAGSPDAKKVGAPIARAWEDA